MTSHLNKKGSKGAIAIVTGGRPGKTIFNNEARHHYDSDLCHRQWNATRTVDFDFFINAGIDTLIKFETIGWGPFFTLNKLVHLKMVKEFYSNLSFDEELRGLSMIKGCKIELTPDYLAEVIGCPNEGV